MTGSGQPAPGLPPLLLVGGGKMGGALLTGWLERELAPSVLVDPAPDAARHGGGPITVVPDLEAVPAGFTPHCVILAVKPQQSGAVLPGVRPFAARSLTLSIMAGVTVAGLRSTLGDRPVVRAMPNTPAAIRRGITVGFAGPGVETEQRVLADTLLSAVGEVAWVDDEALIDPVTAISGGGPAYVFLLAELLEQAGREQGLPPALARQLARVTVAGSGALLAASDDEAAALRRAVTSPGGTTERALAVLMDAAAWPAAVSRAITAATQRSRELGG